MTILSPTVVIAVSSKCCGPMVIRRSVQSAPSHSQVDPSNMSSRFPSTAIEWPVVPATL
jgi:hypothetical protein